ncbi:MAG: hypothetical protein JW738_00660 [Actinobacteria bacterium]|nr:hypothetical protein [Actinomycetota bacterium]
MSRYGGSKPEMYRFTREEIKNLTDKELKIANKRIKRDYLHGLIIDDVVPVENSQLLEEELRRRGHNKKR